VRPVERGPTPRNYSEYGDAIGDLEERMGTYCSYCERRLPIRLAVEHVCPKSLNLDKELEWENFLLGCTNCNSVKGDTDIDLDDYVWSDRDNTLLVLQYGKGGFVDVASGLGDAEKDKAESLVKLVGRDRHPYRQGAVRPARRDKRWSQRSELWDTAEKAKNNYELLGRSPEALELVLDIAKGYGFFGIWFQLFEAYPEVKAALIRRFPGTAPNCFDADFNPITRPQD
jgi:hypothetical protein